MKTFRLLATLFILYAASQSGIAQQADHDNHPDLHVNPRWKECSFQLDPSLTQSAWHQFTREAGLVAYFRPVTDAKPLGGGHFEVSVLQGATAIDDHDAAWNDTFVHPDSAHYLTEGSRLTFPGITARVGITDKIDLGFYFTKNPNANYGFWSAQLQYNLINDRQKNWSATARINFTNMFGPEDLKLSVYGIDALISKEFRIYSDWAYIAPYAGVSAYVSSARETTSKVELHDENILGGQVMAGAVVKLSIARIGVEYNLGQVSTISLKLGAVF